MYGFISYNTMVGFNIKLSKLNPSPKVPIIVLLRCICVNEYAVTKQLDIWKLLVGIAVGPTLSRRATGTNVDFERYSSF